MLVAVSGGIDSVVLAHALHEISADEALKAFERAQAVEPHRLCAPRRCLFFTPTSRAPTARAKPREHAPSTHAVRHAPCRLSTPSPVKCEAARALSRPALSPYKNDDNHRDAAHAH